MPKKRKLSAKTGPAAKRAPKPKPKPKSKPKAKPRQPWTADELERVLDVYDGASSAIHEGNPLIEELGRQLGRSTRSVEAQLIMFRALDRGGRSGWGNMSSLARELWKRRKSSAARPNAKVGESGNSSLDTLLSRAFGGIDVAAKPGDAQGFWPVGPGPLGVDAVIDMLAKECLREGAVDHQWVFLLGAAGNGKSSAANALIDRVTKGKIREAAAEKGIAMRAYRYKLRSNGELVVINDATIARRSEYGEDVPIALATDMRSWAAQLPKRMTHALICANRGVIIEELHALDGMLDEKHAFSKAVLAWLDSGDRGPLDAMGLVRRDLTGRVVERSAGYYRRTRLRLGGQTVVIHAVSVDVGSLCEPRLLTNQIDVGQNLSLPPVDVCRSLREPKDGRLQSVAAALTRELIATRVAALVSERPRQCPIVANVRALMGEASLCTWVTTIRAAEIAAGTQFTYRDFWGIVALSIVGPRTTFGAANGPGASIAADIDELMASAEREANPLVRLNLMTKLAVRRTHMALFQGAPLPIEFGRVDLPPSFPALPGFVRVDPAQDICRHTAIVTEAVDVISVGLRPSQILAERIETFESIWLPFDAWLEDSVLACMHCRETIDTEKRSIASWYAAYLMRLLGTYVDGLGHEAVLEAWYQCWGRANKTVFPTEIERGLRAIVAPSIRTQDGHGSLLAVPAFSSRAEPLRDCESSEGELVAMIESDRIRLKPVRSGDRLWVELTSPDQSGLSVRSPLDFTLLREALACCHGLGGFTEESAEASPRMERARASLLTPGAAANVSYAAIIGTRLVEVGP